MRKPAHASADAGFLAATVFAKGKRNALFEATGLDPAHIAKTVAEHPRINESERVYVRAKVKDALCALKERRIANMTDLQLDIGGRRIRCRYN